MSKGKRTTYSPAFKAELVRLYLEGGRSYQQLTDEFGLKDKKTLRSWVAKMNRGESLEDRRGKRTGPRRGRPRIKFDSLEEKLAYVEAERDYLKKLYRSRFGHEWGAHKKGTSSE
jgi:transposase-like protein